MSQLKTFLAQTQERIGELLDDTISKIAFKHSNLHEAMHYSLLNGGKRVRPLLVYATAQAVNSHNKANIFSDDTLNAFACAIEIVHSYSLVHDDLPAMDDDDLRRGKPTCHIQFDEATAILAGDALQCLAFETLATAPLAAEQRIQAIQCLAQAAGDRGMVQGQAIDLAAVNQQLERQALESMHSLKTGALIRAAVTLGAIATSASTAQQQQLDNYAKAIGLAFQVQDDILDVVAETAELGKPQGADAHLNKPTYVSLLGLGGARVKAQQLRDEAITNLQGFGPEANILRQLASYIVERGH